MKYPMHLILDSYSHPGISLFWKRHGLSIMEQLVPNEFFFTTGDTPLEKLVEREIWSGWKKIILIGTPDSIRRGFNTLMQASRECRSTLEIGFWPLDLQNLATCISQSSLFLKPVLQVFKAGHSVHVDLMKVQILAPELETRYFWNDFEINSTQTAAQTTIFIDEQNSELSGKFSCRIAFHDEILSSLTMHPGKLTRTPVLKIYLKREVSLTAKERFKQLRKWLAVETKSAEKETLLKTGKQVEVQGNWANLTLNVAAIQESVQSMHFAVERKAFSLIIPAKPIQSTESIRNIIPAFRPRGVIANNRGATKKVQLRFEEKPRYDQE
ncbi:MAG: hypothetical protein VYA44_04480 [SAR324 cluster bacterium]|nr:hypothetical protein [SAR324 cluster bacterium]MEC7887096.1 hypothetical protein [SAR324 cluster bacterium]MED5402991.1 hypothetical protein [SAR324 cluster bacterium]